MNSNYIMLFIEFADSGKPFRKKSESRASWFYFKTALCVFSAGYCFFFFWKQKSFFSFVRRFEAILCFSFPFSFTCFEKWENPDIVPRQLGCRDQIENSNWRSVNFDLVQLDKTNDNTRFRSPYAGGISLGKQICFALKTHKMFNVHTMQRRNLETEK